MELDIAINRIEKYLKEDNIDKSFLQANFKPNSDIAIKIENGNFYWVTKREKEIAAEKNKVENKKLSPEELNNKLRSLGLIDNPSYKDEIHYVLKNINMTIKKGSFVVILGE